MTDPGWFHVEPRSAVGRGHATDIRLRSSGEGGSFINRRKQRRKRDAPPKSVAGRNQLKAMLSPRSRR
jgi:hypothetical protein